MNSLYFVNSRKRVDKPHDWSADLTDLTDLDPKKGQPTLPQNKVGGKGSADLTDLGRRNPSTGRLKAFQLVTVNPTFNWFPNSNIAFASTSQL